MLKTICYVENVPIANRVIWTWISNQQTQVLKWIVLLEFAWLESLDIWMCWTEVWRDVCKVDMKCNIANSYCLPFHTQYSLLNASEEIFKYRPKLTSHETLQKWQRKISFEHYKTI